MSNISSTDELVTKQDLSDYHDLIKPYLNGTPFSYSTNETVIGTWIDGKPLYQKTVNFGALPNNTNKSVSHGISNVSKIVSAKAYSTNGTDFAMQPFISKYTNVSWDVQLDVTKTAIKITTEQDWSSHTECYVTLQYTKTTD